VDLKKASAEEMRRSVYANYAAFIRLVVPVCINILKTALVLLLIKKEIQGGEI